MANELSVDLKVIYNTTVITNRIVRAGPISVSQTTKVLNWRTHTVAYSADTAAAINIVGTADQGYVVIKNLGTVVAATDYVEFGTGTNPFVPFVKLFSGEVACFRLNPDVVVTAISKAALSTDTQVDIALFDA